MQSEARIRKVETKSVKTRHRGFILPIALTSLLLLSMFCATMLTMANMDVRYTATFEKHALLKQVVVSTADSLAYSILDGERANAWLDITSPLSGVVVVGEEGDDGKGLPPVSVEYQIEPDGGIWRISAEGRFAGGDDKKTAWGVSVDVAPKSRVGKIRWSEPVRRDIQGVAR